MEKNKHSSFLFLINLHFDEYVSYDFSSQLDFSCKLSAKQRESAEEKKDENVAAAATWSFFGKNKIYKWKWIQLFLIGALVWNTSVDAKSEYSSLLG